MSMHEELADALLKLCYDMKASSPSIFLTFHSSKAFPMQHILIPSGGHSFLLNGLSYHSLSEIYVEPIRDDKLVLALQLISFGSGIFSGSWVSSDFRLLDLMFYLSFSNCFFFGCF